MGLWNKVKGWFSKEEPKEEVVDQEVIDVIAEPVDQEAFEEVEEILAAAEPVEPQKRDWQVFEHTVTHRTKEETEQIKEEIKARPPIQPTPQPEPQLVPRRQRTDRARDLMARRQAMREAALRRPNGTEVGPDA